MANGLSDLSVTLFDLVGYVFPGLIAIILFSSITDLGLQFVADNLLFMLLIAYLLGNVLHHISDVNSLRNFLWSIYHKTKEAGFDGHGIKAPRSFKGKCAKWLRYHILENQNPSEIKGDLEIKRISGLKKINNFDLSLLKEVLLAKNKDLNTYYQYLHYQRIFNRSISLLFSIFGVTVLIYDKYYTLIFKYSTQYQLNADGNSVIIFMIFMFLSQLFSNRAKYFTAYRKNILNISAALYKEK